MPGSTFFVWNVSCLGVKPFQYNLDCCVFDPVSSVFWSFLTCYAECIHCNISYWGCLPVCYFHVHFITACIWSASKRSIELTFQTRRFMVKLSVCETDISFAWLCLKWRRAASTFLWTFFFIVFHFKGPAHCHNSSQVQAPHFFLYTIYSLHSFPIIFGECYHKQQGWGSHRRVAEDSPGMQCCVSGQETQVSHFIKLESCYQFLILKFSINSKLLFQCEYISVMLFSWSTSVSCHFHFTDPQYSIVELPARH